MIIAVFFIITLFYPHQIKRAASAIINWWGRIKFIHTEKILAVEEKIFQGEEVMVKAYSRKDLPLNEMAQVGARSFSVEETERYAGSIGDPSRMASGYH